MPLAAPVTTAIFLWISMITSTGSARAMPPNPSHSEVAAMVRAAGATVQPRREKDEGRPKATSRYGYELPPLAGGDGLVIGPQAVRPYYDSAYPG